MLRGLTPGSVARGAPAPLRRQLEGAARLGDRACASLEVPGRSVSGGWRRSDAFNFASTRGTPPASRCCATRRRTRPGRSSSFASSIRRTRREASGTAASRRASFAAPRSTPIGSKGRTNRSTGSASIRRRSCSIPTRRRCSSRRVQPRSAARSPGRPTAARRWAVCRDRQAAPPPTEAGPRYTCRDADRL